MYSHLGREEGVAAKARALGDLLLRDLAGDGAHAADEHSAQGDHHRRGPFFDAAPAGSAAASPARPGESQALLAEIVGELVDRVRPGFALCRRNGGWLARGGVAEPVCSG